MKPVLRPILAVFLLLGFLLPAQANSDVAEISLKWLTFIDAGHYDDSWSHGSTLLRAQQMPDKWQARMKRLHDAYGDVSMRSVTGVSFSKSLPGFPDGSYATVRFQSSFFKQRNASETVALRFEDGQWRAVSYTLR
jgi:hypothetical protein